MMKNMTEQTGKTVEEAIRRGLEELKVARDDVQIDVLEEPTSGGILGLLSSTKAKVRLTVVKKMDNDLADKTISKVKEFIDGFFKTTGEEFKYEIFKKDEHISLEIAGENIAHLIGYKGCVIDSLQALINTMLIKSEEDYAKVYVEVGNYKAKKDETLKRLANKMAENVIKFKKPIRLEYMSAYERKIVHTELQKYDKILSESIGEEPRRRIVIKLK